MILKDELFVILLSDSIRGKYNILVFCLSHLECPIIYFILAALTCLKSNNCIAMELALLVFSQILRFHFFKSNQEQ